MNAKTLVKSSVVAKLCRLHYWLMDSPYYWNRPDLRAADSFVCKCMSDLRAGKFDRRATLKEFRWPFLATLIAEVRSRRRSAEATR